MPEMDGVETLHRIRNKVGSYYHKVPVIALTANAVAGTREMLINLGFNDFLEKPVERSVLERVIKRNLPSEKIIAVGRNTTTAAKGEDEFGIEGLDVKSGILYCGGREQYIRILQSFCNDYEGQMLQLKELYNNKDWTNYTITVHGIKSAMKSIGALKLSDTAKGLESAGKENRTDYIIGHHDAFVAEYKELFAQLRKKDFICAGSENNNVESVSETEDVKTSPISPQEFDAIIEKLETAAYTLDVDGMLEQMDKLWGLSYRNTALAKSLATVKRKVEMSDYISAVDMVASIKKRLDEGGADYAEKVD